MQKQYNSQQQQRQEGESVEDIKSQEMVLEDVDDRNKIMVRGQQIEEEDNDEIQEDDEEGAEYLDN